MRGVGSGRLDIEGVSHVVTGRRWKGRIIHAKSEPAGAAFIHRNVNVLPRARLAGRPIYAEDQRSAAAALHRLVSASQLRDQLLVEDPSHPLHADATVTGTEPKIVEDLPERVVIETDAETPAYLVLSDTYDPGWSATVDGRAAPIRPAYVAFRAVFLPAGKHTVVFTYRPAGFELGLKLTCGGVLLALVLWFWPPRRIPFTPDHAVLDWPPHWRIWWFVALGAIVLVSAIGERHREEATRSTADGNMAFIASPWARRSRRCTSNPTDSNPTKKAAPTVASTSRSPGRVTNRQRGFFAVLSLRSTA